MKQKYAFNLGRIFTLSLAELFAVFEQMKLSFTLTDLYREVLIIETESELNVRALQDRLGGTIKIIQIIDSLGRKKDMGPSQVFKDYFDIKILQEKYLASTKGKIQFGISLYPMAKQVPLRDEAKRIGLQLKHILTTNGFSSRVVLPQKMAVSLPSVVVTKEHLLEKGAEIDFLVGFDRIYVGKTITVQDFEAYGRRDYQRPVRDMQVGLLPPKVAQIMINLARLPTDMKGNPDKAMLDPFVGSGTVIQEAMIQNIKGVGSDISEQAILSAEKNLLWIRNRYQVPPNRFELIVSDVKDLKANIPNLQYEGVVTEGTLGPAYKNAPAEAEIHKNFKELEPIYLNAFRVLKDILGSDKRIIIAVPAYRKGLRYIYFPIVDKIKDLGYDVVDPLPEILREKFDFLEVTERKSIIYDRKDQFVSREIFIFKLK